MVDVNDQSVAEHSKSLIFSILNSNTSLHYPSPITIRNFSDQGLRSTNL